VSSSGSVVKRFTDQVTGLTKRSGITDRPLTVSSMIAIVLCFFAYGTSLRRTTPCTVKRRELPLPPVPEDEVRKK
jgi:hypothetical protein